MLQFLKSGYRAITSALKKTRAHLSDRLHALFSGPINEEMLDSLEEIFYEADLGVTIAQELTTKTKAFLRKSPNAEAKVVLQFLEQEIAQLLAPFDYSLHISKETSVPTVIFVVGTNGNGIITCGVVVVTNSC